MAIGSMAEMTEANAVNQKSKFIMYPNWYMQ